MAVLRTRIVLYHYVEIAWVERMIEVTKLNDEKFIINCDLIETIEETPDTLLTLTTGRKIIVKESRQLVENLVKSYRKEIFAGILRK